MDWQQRLLSAAFSTSESEPRTAEPFFSREHCHGRFEAPLLSTLTAMGWLAAASDAAMTASRAARPARSATLDALSAAMASPASCRNSTTESVASATGACNQQRVTSVTVYVHAWLIPDHRTSSYQSMMFGLSVSRFDKSSVIRTCPAATAMSTKRWTLAAVAFSSSAVRAANGLPVCRYKVDGCQLLGCQQLQHYYICQLLRSRDIRASVHFIKTQ